MARNAPDRKPSRQRSSMLNVRLKPEEHQKVKQDAIDQGISVGELLRRALGLAQAV